MGYRTYHTLDVFDEELKYLEKAKEEHELQISRFVEGDDCDYSLFEDEEKWYSCEEDMKRYSKLYPEFIFKISGVGEEHDDLWEMYCKNGKLQFCPAHITFDEYDENKLK